MVMKGSMRDVRNGKGWAGEHLLFPDPLVDNEGLRSAEVRIMRTHTLCSHCHMEIVGKVHRSGMKAYDSYCWSMRYILELEESGSDRHGEKVRPPSGTDGR